MSKSYYDERYVWHHYKITAKANAGGAVALTFIDVAPNQPITARGLTHDVKLCPVLLY